MTIAEKKKLIEKIEEGGKKSDVAKGFKIPLSTLSTIIKHKNKINFAQTAGVRKRTSKGEFPRLEESLVTVVEILTATDTNEKSNDEDEDDTSEPLTEVSLNEARSSFDTLQRFCLQNESDYKAFEALFLLKKVIEQSEQQRVLKQTSITKFFRKIN